LFAWVIFSETKELTQFFGSLISQKKTTYKLLGRKDRLDFETNFSQNHLGTLVMTWFSK
jgi:hypothetical protein